MARIIWQSFAIKHWKRIVGAISALTVIVLFAAGLITVDILIRILQVLLAIV